jgi:hypothetical protein
MRTPGRCSNTLTCWLATSHRDIWVPVGEEFACPVCDSPLHAPPIQSVTARHRGYTTLASAALIVMSGLAGFGVMRLVDTTPHQSFAAKGSVQTIGSLGFSATPSPQPLSELTIGGNDKISAAANGGGLSTGDGPQTVALNKLPLPVVPVTAKSGLPAIDHSAPARRPTVIDAYAPRPEPADVAPKPTTEEIIAAEVHNGEAELFPARPALPIPISTTGVVPPEDDTPLPVRNWHHRWSGRVHRASYQVAPAHHAAAAPSDDAAAAEAEGL